MSAVATISPQEAAQKVLDSVWKDRPFPVDPARIAGLLGLKVIETDLPEEVSGAIIKKKDEDPIIIISKADSKNRQRFSCAHELGHYVYHMDMGQEKYEWVDLRGTAAGLGTNPEEIFANGFAAALLMPEEEVNRLYKEKTPPFLMAIHFGVSDDAMNYRLKNLSLAA